MNMKWRDIRMKNLKRILSLILCFALLTTTVPVNAYSGPICKKHNYNMLIVESTYDSQNHYYKKGKCTKCGAWKTITTKRHRYTTSGLEYLAKVNNNSEIYKRTRVCSIGNEVITTERFAYHNFIKHTQNVNNRTEKAIVTTYTCTHSKCKYSYSKKKVLHTHRYTKKARGGKCTICGKKWA